MTALGDDATVPKINVTSDVTWVGKGLTQSRTIWQSTIGYGTLGPSDSPVPHLLDARSETGVRVATLVTRDPACGELRPTAGIFCFSGSDCRW